MAYKKCVDCKRSLPEHLIEDHELIFKSPICPICARTITNKIKGNQPGTPFENTFSQEDYLEAKNFLQYQCVPNRGGHIINPPDKCPHSFMDENTGTTWVDTGRCNIACKDFCSRYYQFLRMTSDERREELIENGVRFY